MTQEQLPEGTRAVIESNVFALNGGSMARSKCINNICAHIESLLKEERNAVLEEVEREVEKDLDSIYNYPFNCYRENKTYNVYTLGQTSSFVVKRLSQPSLII